MPYLVAVITLLALVTLFDLVVTVGLVRRLRAHSDLLAGLAGGGSEMLAAGTAVPEFSGESIDGLLVDREWLSGPAAVAFLAVDCPHCQTNLPEFVAYVRGGGYTREAVLAVIAYHGQDSPAADDMVSVLAPVATVVREISGGAIAAAFSVRGFPTFYLVGVEGTLTAAAHAVRGLPNTVVRDAAAAAARAAT